MYSNEDIDLGKGIDLDKGFKKPKTAYVPLDERKYKAEQELVDRYKWFVAEILRLSLAGIAVFGFLFKEVFKNVQSASTGKYIAPIGLIMFGVSAFCALIFQYCAAEGLRYYILGFRHYAQSETPSTYDIKKAEESLNVRDKWLKVCFGFKMAATGLLAFGGIFMAWAIVLLLFN
jgi:hypothetical protein